jgi:hypothetical protein
MDQNVLRDLIKSYGNKKAVDYLFGLCRFCAKIFNFYIVIWQLSCSLKSAPRPPRGSFTE